MESNGTYHLLSTLQKTLTHFDNFKHFRSYPIGIIRGNDRIWIEGPVRSKEKNGRPTDHTILIDNRFHLFCLNRSINAKHDKRATQFKNLLSRKETVIEFLTRRTPISIEIDHDRFLQLLCER